MEYPLSIRFYHLSVDLLTSFVGLVALTINQLNTMCKKVIDEIVKRDGRIVPFDCSKISFAIFKATRAIGKPNRQLADDLTNKVLSRLVDEISEDSIPTVEMAQDIIELVLMENSHYKLAKAYILYRKQHSHLRNAKDLLSNLEIIDDYINHSDWRIKESANSTYSLQGLNQHVATIVSSQYWLDRIYPKEIADSHKSGKFHIHDLGFLSVYCVGWDLQDLLLSGFKGVTGKIESTPAKHFRTILGQIVNFFYTMQGEAAGAQAFSNFDTYLAPFIRHDNLNYNQVKQALQEFFFNINVPTRVGFQTPFTNVTMDLKIPDFMKTEPIIIGGEVKEEVYGDFQEEMDVFNKAFMEVMTEGDAKGNVFSFPIPTYNITKDFEWDNPNYDKIFESAGKYGIPYFSNFVNSDMSPDDVRSMCCRLRLDKRELQKRGGGLFGANPLTGSVGVVTINLPRIGFESKSKEEFYQRLGKLMEMAKESLEIKRKVIENLTDKGLFPYSKFYLRKLYKKNNKYWKNHFSTIGLIGMNECCLNFLGKQIIDAEGHDFTLEVMSFMRGRLEEFQEETGNIYNLEATPAEGTSFRLAKLDKSMFSDILTAGTTNTPYYTNSTQLPVGYTDDLFEALRLQDDLQTQYTGGTVFHAFIGEKQLDSNSVKNLVSKVMDNFRLPYFTLSPSFSICPEHGYMYGEHFECPKCALEGTSSKCDIYSRIVGYIRPVIQWNEGKRAEFEERKLFDRKLEELVKIE